MAIAILDICSRWPNYPRRICADLDLSDTALPHAAPDAAHNHKTVTAHQRSARPIEVTGRLSRRSKESVFPQMLFPPVAAAAMRMAPLCLGACWEDNDTFTLYDARPTGPASLPPHKLKFSPGARPVGKGHEGHGP